MFFIGIPVVYEQNSCKNQILSLNWKNDEKYDRNRERNVFGFYLKIMKKLDFVFYFLICLLFCCTLILRVLVIKNWKYYFDLCSIFVRLMFPYISYISLSFLYFGGHHM